MHSTGFSCPSRSIRVCRGSARWFWPAAVMTAFLMRKEAPGWADRRPAQKTIVALSGVRLCVVIRAQIGGGGARSQPRTHLSWEKWGRTLRRPGLAGFCRAYPAASDLAGIYEDVGAVLITLSTSSVHSFRFSTSVSDGAAIGAIRTPPGIIRSNGRSSRRSPPRRGTTVKLSRAYGKSVPPHTQRLLASKKTVAAARVVRAATFQFESSMGGQAFSGRLPLSD